VSVSKKAIVLLSGGLDSTTCLAIAKAAGYELYAISFDYGQRHRIELQHAVMVAEHYNVKEHLLARIGFESLTALKSGQGASYVPGAFGGSALTDPVREIPKDGVKPGIAPTYVPGRNMIFLSFGIGWADAIGADSVFIGVNVLDSSGYPDCRWGFIESMRSPAWLGTRAGADGRLIDLKAPLVADSKKEIVLKGHELGVPWNLTHSCYAPEPRSFGEKELTLACGKCDSCRLRRKGFEEAGLKDPISYA
jgi:7-cyano-7-deazaguanine synthase